MSKTCEQIKQHYAVLKHFDSMQNFDRLIQKIKDDEDEVAKLAIKQFGSVEKYTGAMKYNLEHFSEIMEQAYSQLPEEMKREDSFPNGLPTEIKTFLPMRCKSLSGRLSDLYKGMFLLHC